MTGDGPSRNHKPASRSPNNASAVAAPNGGDDAVQTRLPPATVPEPATPGEPPSQSGETPTDWLLIGEITGVFGLKGEVKVRPETDFPERFARTPVAYLGAEHIPLAVTAARVAPGGQVILHLAGVSDATAAAKLRGKQIFVPASEATVLPPDQYYVHDLIGLRAVRPDGTALGTLADVYTGPGNDLYVIREAGTGREVLVPAVKEMILQVDLAASMIVIAPVPGLFDDHAEIAE